MTETPPPQAFEPDVTTAGPTAPGVHGLDRRGWFRDGLLRGSGLVGLLLIGVVAVAGVFAPLLAPYGPLEQVANANLIGPSAAHWLGTDEVNRDVLSRTLYGIRVDLVVVFVAVPLGAIVGALVGLLSTVSAAADIAAQRLFDLVFAFPTLILAIALTAVIGPGIPSIVVVIVATEIPIFGRLIRTSVLTVREQPYVEASLVVGASRWWLLRRHVLPNSLEPLTVQLAMSMSVAVFIEGAMSFLGIGVRPPDPSLGSLIKDGTRYMYESPYFAAGPLMAVAMLVLGFLLLSQSLARAARR